MGLNVSYRHFGNQAAVAKDVRTERETERDREEGKGDRQRGGIKKERIGHMRPTAMAT